MLALVVVAVAALSSGGAAVTVPVTNVTLATRACQPPFDSLPFCNASLPRDTRIRDLIARLTPDEIVPMLSARARGGEERLRGQG